MVDKCSDYDDNGKEISLKPSPKGEEHLEDKKRSAKCFTDLKRQMSCLGVN